MGFIADVRTGAYDVLVALQAANPTLLGEVHRARPAGYSIGTAIGFVGDFRGTLQQTVRIRQWMDSGTEIDLVLVFTGADNEEQQAAMDTLTGLLLDAWPDDGHFVENTVGDPVRVRTADLQVKEGISHPAVVVTIGRIAHLEGR